MFGAREAAWPLIRTDLGLTYAGIGLLIAIPNLVGAAVEPALGLLGDAGHRRRIVIGGGLCFVAGLCLVAAAPGFAMLTVAFVVLSVSSGAFVSLSQATLMDLDPKAHERNMARWVLAGSLGVVAGPLALAAVRTAGWGWRGLMLVLAAASLVLVASATRVPFAGDGDGPNDSLSRGAIRALRALREWRVVRWLIVLELSDLMGDVFFGFLALYMVDVAGTDALKAGLAIVTWTAAGLIGHALLLSVLKRAPGRRYLRFSAASVCVVFPAFLLAPSPGTKMVLLAPLGLLNAGWYAIPQAGLYSEMRGLSGTAIALADLGSIVGALFPLAIGLLAQRVGLQAAMWVLMLGPAALLFVLPRARP